MRILTHNVYWFQGYPSRWGEERLIEAPEVLRDLIRLYSSAAVDVLCLQEVQRSDLVETIARDLGMTSWLHAPGGRRPDYGGAILCRRTAELRDVTRADGRALHERIHLRASLRDLTVPIELAVLHLPSDRFVDSTCAGHAARVAELKRALDESPRPDVVVGDLNCGSDSPPYQTLSEYGYLDAALTAGQRVPKHRCDYVWVNEKFADRLVRFTVLDKDTFCRTTQDGKVWWLSDHPPLVMELR